MSPLARRLHWWLAVFIAAALLLRLGLTIFAPDPPLTGEDAPGLGLRLVRFVSYFTIESAAAVLLASVVIVRGVPLDTPWVRALRLASLIGITVTGIVYVVVLSGEPVDRSALSSVANLALHYVAPPLTVLVWLVVGPWPGFRWADIARVMVWPVLWGSWTALHGELSHWYPYGFVDVNKHGYGTVAVNFLFIVLFAGVLGAAFTLGDRRRGRTHAGPAA